MSAAASQRRRAAGAVFASLLSEEALFEALQWQQQTLSSDGVAAIIGFIDAVADRNGLDAATRKRLYRTYHEALQRPESELPLDPWPAMLAAQPVLASPRAAAAATLAAVLPPPVPAPSVPDAAPPAPAAPSPSAATADAGVATQAPAEQQVFAALAKALLAAVQQSHVAALGELRQAALEQLPRLRSTPAVREQLRTAWQAGDAATWMIAAGESTLAEIVNQLYVALCEVLGPIDADRLLTDAVLEARRCTAARSFSPQRLV